MPLYTKDGKELAFDPDGPHVVGLYSDSAKAGIGIEMVNGGRFLILDPKASALDPQVLAHALSNLCRFTGHTQKFYSVAQHCVIVSKIVPPELAMQGLLHDASEAFIGDLSRPLKAILDILAPGILFSIEERIHEVIAEKFKSGFPHDPAVKIADNVSLATEKRDLMAETGRPWYNLPDPLPTKIKALGPRGARNLWLDRFEELGGKL